MCSFIQAQMHDLEQLPFPTGIDSLTVEAEFEVREEALGAAVTRQYADAAIMWCQLRREFLYAAEQLEVSPMLLLPSHCPGSSFCRTWPQPSSLQSGLAVIELPA